SLLVICLQSLLPVPEEVTMTRRTRPLVVGSLFLIVAALWLVPATAPTAPPPDPVYNTFSIVAYAPDTQSWGCAVASKGVAVGARVPWAKAGQGAVATHAQTNVMHGPNGPELLGTGKSAEEAVKARKDSDKNIEVRQ